MTGAGDPLSESPILARLDAAVALAICLGGGVVALFLPHYLAHGGMAFMGGTRALSPSFFPQLSMGILSVLGGIYFVRALANARRVVGAVVHEELSGYLRAFVTVLIVGFYASLVPWVGFVFATMIMCCILVIFLGIRNPLTIVAFAVALPFAIRFVFERLLLIALPTSSIPTLYRAEESVLRAMERLFGLI